MGDTGTKTRPLTVSEAAVLLGISPASVYRAIKQGWLVATADYKGRPLIAESAIEACREKRAQDPYLRPRPKH